MSCGKQRSQAFPTSLSTRGEACFLLFIRVALSDVVTIIVPRTSLHAQINPGYLSQARKRTGAANCISSPAVASEALIIKQPPQGFVSTCRMETLQHSTSASFATNVSSDSMVTLADMARLGRLERRVGVAAKRSFTFTNA